MDDLHLDLVDSKERVENKKGRKGGEENIKKAGQRRSVLLSTIVIAMLTVLTIHPVQAAVYSAHGQYHLDYIGVWDVYLTVDTTAHTLRLKWSANCIFGFWYFGSYIHVWDDYGRIYWLDCPLGTHISAVGEKTFSYALTGVVIHAEVRWSHSIGYKMLGFQITVRCDLTVPVGEGGGCPILQVYDGSDYVYEGLLDIHNPEGVDVVYEHSLAATPERVNGAYMMRLTEHPQTHSFIDQVKLHAILEDGTIKELPLIWAWHSEDGNVRPQLLQSDEWKTDTYGADHNNGVSQSIDLKFAALPPHLKIVGFIFQIEGNNNITKR